MDANIVVAVCVFGISLFLYTRLKPKNESCRTHKEKSQHYELSKDWMSLDAAAQRGDREKAFRNTSRLRKVSASLRLFYDNGSGSLIEEVVEVKQIDHYLEKSVFSGYVEGAEKPTTFFYDLIRRCIDLDTGETVDNVQQYLNDKYENSVEKTCDLLLYKYVDVLQILWFIGQKNGLLEEPAVVRIHNYACTLTDDSRLTQQQVLSLMTKIAPVSLSEFTDSLEGLKELPDFNFRELVRCCEELSELHKKQPKEHDLAMSSLKEITVTS